MPGKRKSASSSSTKNKKTKVETPLILVASSSAAAVDSHNHIQEEVTNATPITLSSTSTSIEPIIEEASYHKGLDNLKGEIATKFTLNFDSDETEFKILGVDLGSSFTKMATLFGHIVTNQYNKECWNVKDCILRFTPHGDSYTSSTLYYCNGEYSLNEKNWPNSTHPVIPLFTIKKLLTVKYQSEVIFNNVKFRVSTIMYELVKCILKQADLESEVVKFKHVVFTIPTSSSEKSKKIFRNCIQMAIKKVFPQTTIGPSDIFIIEEYRLLNFCLSANQSSGAIREYKKIILLVDIGHLTVDSTCMEKKDNNSWNVVHSSSEVSGTSRIHAVFEKHGLDAMRVLGKMFNSSSKSISSSLVQDENVNIDQLERDIATVCTEIVACIFEICLELKVEHVILFGAITIQPYFNSLFTDILTFNNFGKFVKTRNFLKPNFKPVKFTTQIFNCQRTALIQGMRYLAEIGCGNEVPIKHNYQEKFVEIPAILYEINGQKCLSIRKEHSLILGNIQQVELFILKFRKTTNLELLEKVTVDNFDKIGLYDCERHSTLSIEFAIKKWDNEFILTFNLEEESIDIIYPEKNEKMIKKFAFDRSNCAERVSIDEIKDILRKDESHMSKNWFGKSFKETLVIGPGQGTVYNETPLPIAHSEKTKRKTK